MKTNETKISRRQALTLAGASAASICLPGAVFGQTTKQITILQGSGSVLLAWAPSFIAEDIGLYKEEGITVERVLNGSGPAGLSALLGSSAAILLNPPGEPLGALARGQKLKVLMAQSNFQASQLIISKDYAAKYGVTEDMPLDRKLAITKNFKGIRCGVTSPGSLSDHAARAMIKGMGLDPATDAQILPLGSVPNAMAAMSRGALDAFSGAAPAGELAQAQQGAVILFRNSKDEIPGYKALSGHVINARAVDVEQNADMFATLVRADTKGLRYIVDNPKAAGELLYKSRYASMAKEVWAQVWEMNRSQFRTPYVTKESIEAWINLGVTPSPIDKKTVDIGRMIDMRFVDQAVQKIGWKVQA
ncbi:ABC transporter substrate-binding protein [Polaromonas sp. P1(28)-13]|nr:ABC transporter substrate-binding protein [Polaromonas sp. P1(28)-13]